MLYWICPECGHECSPAIRECPTCTTAEIVSLAQSFQSAPPNPARPRISETAKPALSPLPATLATPALVSASSVAAKGPQAEFGLTLAGLAPTRNIAFQTAPWGPPKPHQQPVEPAPSVRRSVAFVRQASTGVVSGGIALADFAPPSQLRRPELQCSNGTGVAPVDLKPGRLALISSKLKLAGASLAELERSAVQAIRASFQEQPEPALLCAAREIVTAPAPPAEQWMRSPKIVLTAKAPGTADAMLTTAPQPPTLAGPCLPPQLQRFTESRSRNQRPARKRASAPTWMLSLLVGIALFLVAGSLLQYITDNRDAKAASVPSEPRRTSKPAPEPPIPVAEEHPGARFIEVAGVRVVTAPNRKPQLQYIVINHSAAELTGLNIHIALRSADSPAGAPLIRVSSIVPSLGANQSKEIRTDLDAGLNAASIPDWQSLRTEILVSRQ